jgi:hypothetical protein
MGDNQNHLRYGASRHFKNKKREYLKDRIGELATDSKNKSNIDVYRGVNVYKRSKRKEN